VSQERCSPLFVLVFWLWESVNIDARHYQIVQNSTPQNPELSQTHSFIVTKPFIELENTDVVIAGQSVLRDVSWQLHSGENWAFVGGNGAGKSTLLKLIRGDIWPSHSKGSRLYRFDNIETSSPLRARDHIGWVSGAQHDRYRRQE